MKVRLNDQVRVKLTPHGKDMLERDHIAFWDSTSHPNPPAFQLPEEDAEGWSKWTLWVLMAEFGPHIYQGAELCFEIEIDIPTKEQP